MSLAREALIEFGSVFRFEDLDRACVRILNAAQRDLSRLSRHGVTQAELDQLLMQRDRTADVYAVFRGEGRKESLHHQEPAQQWAQGEWQLQGEVTGSLSYDPSEVAFPASGAEAVPTSEAQNSALPDQDSGLEAAAELQEGWTARERGRPSEGGQGNDLLTVVTPREAGIEEEGFAGSDRLSYEKGILYGLLRHLCRLARLEFSDKDHRETYSLPQPRENLTSITLH